ncbi:MAG TPA: rod shape-determining protein MreC, partial [Candidatus Woesebacteria bacterium]|nr:rod shape-determining protein MreC [Candidatus Woesebacteria bacterium]
AQPTIALDPDQKVTPGTAVLVEGVLVGTIAKQQLGTATVNLLWQKETLPILAETDSKVQGLVMGDGRRVLFTEVPVDQELTIGQQVVSVGQTGVEQGLFIGEIRAIVTGYSNAVKTAVLEQYVSFYQVGLVEVRF